MYRGEEEEEKCYLVLPATRDGGSDMRRRDSQLLFALRIIGEEEEWLLSEGEEFCREGEEFLSRGRRVFVEREKRLSLRRVLGILC